MLNRLTRAGKELLGLPQWPRAQAPSPSSFEDQIYAAIVQPGDLFFDIGANVGSVSLLAARYAGESGKVVAFEPVWPTYLELCRQVQLDTWWKAPIVTLPFGLADAERRQTIHVPRGEFGLASLAEANAQQVTDGANIVGYDCSFVTFDGWLGTAHLPVPDVIKIDVEGAELLVLRGCRATLGADHRPMLLMEIFAPWEEGFGYTPWEPLSLLAQHGYRFLFACPNGLVAHEPSAAQPFPSGFEDGYNVLAYDPSRHTARIERLESLRPGGRILPMQPAPQKNRIRPRPGP